MASKQTGTEVNLLDAIQQFCMDKGLSREAVLDIIKDSLVSAYKKKMSMDRSVPVTVEFNDKFEVVIVVPKIVVDQDKNPGPLEISIKDAMEINPEIELGVSLTIREKPVELSRIVSNQARQMVFQKLKEKEREMLYNEYKVKEGDLTHGFFQRWKNRDTMSIDLGKVEAIMPRKEQTPGERYKQGDKLKAIIARVELKSNKFREPGPIITLSRASADFVKKLFEMEIPEIYDGLIEVVNIARVPSKRTKIVVRANRTDIDPIGSCVGVKGVRIQSIVRELGNERIDIIQYTENPAEFVANAITPAKPIDVIVDYEKMEAIIVVQDETGMKQAFGPSHSNMKLASQVTGYRLEIINKEQYNERMASPAARERLERLFQSPQSAQEFEDDEKEYNDQNNDSNEEEQEYEDDFDEGTPLNEIPGLTKRVINLLRSGGVNDVETLFELHPDELAKIPGIGNTTADHILKLLAESVEFVEES
jgi:N utilization substance protein A